MQSKPAYELGRESFNSDDMSDHSAENNPDLILKGVVDVIEEEAAADQSQTKNRPL